MFSSNSSQTEIKGKKKAYKDKEKVLLPADNGRIWLLWIRRNQGEVKKVTKQK